MTNQFTRAVDTVLCLSKHGTPAYMCADGKVRVQSNSSYVTTIMSKDEIKDSPGYANMELKQKMWLESLFDEAEEYFREHGNEEARNLLNDEQ